MILKSKRNRSKRSKKTKRKHSNILFLLHFIMTSGFATETRTVLAFFANSKRRNRMSLASIFPRRFSGRYSAGQGRHQKVARCKTACPRRNSNLPALFSGDRTEGIPPEAVQKTDCTPEWARLFFTERRCFAIFSHFTRSETLRLFFLLHSGSAFRHERNNP